MFAPCTEIIKKNAMGTVHGTVADLVEEPVDIEKLNKLAGSSEINVWLVGRQTVECI